MITDFFYIKLEDPGTLFLSLQADDKGCFTQLVKTKVFQLRQRGYDMTIQVEAKIKEEGTGLFVLLININSLSLQYIKHLSNFHSM